MGFLFVLLNLIQNSTRKPRDLNQKPLMLLLQKSVRDAELLNTNMNFRYKLFHWFTNSTSDISTNPKPKALPNILQHAASFCSNYGLPTITANYSAGHRAKCTQIVIPCERMQNYLNYLVARKLYCNLSSFSARPSLPFYLG